MTQELRSTHFSSGFVLTNTNADLYRDTTIPSLGIELALNIFSSTLLMRQTLLTKNRISGATTYARRPYRRAGYPQLPHIHPKPRA